MKEAVIKNCCQYSAFGNICCILYCIVFFNHKLLKWLSRISFSVFDLSEHVFYYCQFQIKFTGDILSEKWHYGCNLHSFKNPENPHESGTE